MHVLRDLLTVNQFDVVSNVVELVCEFASFHPCLVLLGQLITLEWDDSDVVDVALGCLLS